MLTSQNLLNNAIALSVSISKIGTRKKVDSRKVQLKEEYGNTPDSDVIAVNKELLKSDSFDAIVKYDNEFRNNLYKLSLPNPLFRNGTYLVPVGLIERIDAMIENYKSNRSILVNNFIADYNDAVYRARETLNGLFNINDYPAIDAVRESFQVSTQYIEIGLPTQLGAFSPEIFRREREAFNEKLVSASEEITAAMRESFSELINHMVERLKPGENGKQKIFRDTLVSNLRDFMETFNARNITNDEDLQKLVDRAREVLNGKSANDLRSIDSIREQVSNGMQEIKNSLSGMVVDAPKRKFSFDD